MESAEVSSRERKTAIVALLCGAVVWGLLWYPYRMLHQLGMDGVFATSLTYGCAFSMALVVWWPRLTRPKYPLWLLGLAISAGGCNIGYVMAVLSGEVVRVLLLFYMAPLWTVILAWWILGERLSIQGGFVMLLSLSGAATMLWQAEHGFPWPRDAADWIGLCSGFFFALFNVLSRRAQLVPVEQRILVSFLGVVVIGGALSVSGVSALSGITGAPLPYLFAAPFAAWGMVVLIGGLLLVTNLVVQFGLVHTPANRAIVIMLSEIGVALVSSWLLADEVLGMKEWWGGAMIIAACLFSTRMRAPD